jgi:hypothetical protein
VVSSGGWERRDDVVIRDFMSEFKNRIKATHTADVSKMYVFTPSNMKNHIVEGLPTTLRKKVAGVIEGNYYKSSPDVLLKKMASLEDTPHIPKRAEARKILDRTRL